MSKTEQIISMLKTGKSYSDIQSALKVSPSKIAQVKKEYADEITMTEKSDSFPGTNTRKVIGSGKIHNPTFGGRMKEREEKQPVKSSSSATTTATTATSDSKLLLKIRRMELEHEERILRLQMEEKERDRSFEEQKMAMERSKGEEEYTRLTSKIAELENRFHEKLEGQENYDDFTDDDQEEDLFFEFALTEELKDDIRSFVQDLKELEGDRLDEDELNKLLELANEIRESIENEHEDAGEDYEECNEWQILDIVANDLESLLADLDSSFWSSSVRYEFDDELTKMLEAF